MGKEKKNQRKLFGKNVGIFATCLIDIVRPSVGFASVKLIEMSGCNVSAPRLQSCCGQPAYNSGDYNSSISIAREVVKVFIDFDYIVVPSGSCCGMIKKHYPELLKDDQYWGNKAKELSSKTYELTEFLSEIVNFEPKISSNWENIPVTYHDSCSGLRELGIKGQPRSLLNKIKGFNLTEGAEAETCCGFGGLFCMKYPDIAEKMVDIKVEDILRTNAKMVLGGDLGCLLNISGRLTRLGKSIEVRHIAEVLADMMEPSAIGFSEEE